MGLSLVLSALAGLPGVMQVHRVGLLYAYGSRLEGTADAASDLDLAAYLPEPDADRRHGQLQRLRRALIDHFREPAIQVADLRQADPLFRLDVIQGLCLWAWSPEAQMQFEAAILRQATVQARLGSERWSVLKDRFRRGFLTVGPHVHRDKVERLLASLEQQVRALEPVSALAETAFMAPEQPVPRFAAAHLLRAALEAMLGVTRHLIVAHGWTRASEPRDQLATLAAKGVLPPDLATALSLICLLKDPLTYPEEGLDFDLVGRVVRENLPLFEAFGRSVVAYLDEAPHQGRLD